MVGKVHTLFRDHCSKTCPLCNLCLLLAAAPGIAAFTNWTMRHVRAGGLEIWQRWLHFYNSRQGPLQAPSECSGTLVSPSVASSASHRPFEIMSKFLQEDCQIQRPCSSLAHQQ